MVSFFRGDKVRKSDGGLEFFLILLKDLFPPDIPRAFS
jgi:hypothetical protein